MKNRSQLTFVSIAITMLTLFMPQTSWAENVTAEQALQQAQTFLRSHQVANGRRNAPGTVPQLTLASQVSGLYVFNTANGDGFVIVSNDDRTTPILGFSDSGTFDPDNIPSNMRAWLQGYADEIAWLKTQTTSQSGQNMQGKAPQRVGSHSTNSILPMVTTTWNQGTPYNNNCPVYQEGRKTVTGCVATAMAQVMYYHKWPAGATTAIPSYEWSRTGETLNGLAATTFDWNNMKDSYSESYTDTEADAVAKLMQYCGWSVQMNYGASSSAHTQDVATALTTYFNYEGTTQYVSRSYYTYANWTDLIYNELSQGRPVVYGGQSSGGGHAFVCDGYQYNNGNDYFHINWGWGGTSDNYFVLSALNPIVQGIGGSNTNDGYNYGQEAIVGIQKKEGTGTVLDNASTVNLIINDITLSQTSVAHGQTVTITANVTNNSNDAYDGELCLVVNRSLGEGKMFVIGAHTTQDCTFEFTPSSAGTYIFMCAKPSADGGYTWNNNLSATLKVDDETPSDLVATDISYDRATIGWTNDHTAFNLQIRPLTITETNFSDGLPTGWRENTQGNDYWLRTPTITLGGSITFWAGGEGKSGSFGVYVNNGGTYSRLSEFTATSTRKEYTVDLSSRSGTSDLAIIVSNATGNSIDVDDFTIIEPGSWTTIDNVTDKSYTFTGLTPETHYEVQVQAVVSNGTTNWSEPLIFSTLRFTPTNLTAIPTNQSALISWTNGLDETKWNVRYLQRDATKTIHDFDETLQEWLIGDADGDGKYWGWSWDKGRNNTRCFISASVDETGVLTPQNRLFTPEFTLGGSISFWARGLDANAAAEQFHLVLLDENNYIVAQLTDDIVTTAEWTQYTVNLRKYSGQGKVMFVHNTVGGQSSLCIDDVVISEPANEWVTINDVTSNPYKLTGLSASSTYDVEVQAVLNKTITSNWSRAVTFTTANSNVLELADDGTTNNDLIAAWDGLQSTVTLTDRTLYKDGNWNTICLPFTVTIADSPLAGAIAKTLTSATMTGTHVELTFGNPDSETAVTELKAGVPYIIKWAVDNENPTITNPMFTDVTVVSGSAADRTISQADGHVKFIGYYDAFNINTPDNDDIYYMTVDNTLMHTGVARTLNACRAYFQFSEAAQATRKFIINFGEDEASAIYTTDYTDETDKADGWYTLDGKRLYNAPTRKGVYIRDGKKVVVK